MKNTMTSCLNITVPQRNEVEYDLKKMSLSNRWKQLQRLSTSNRSRNNYNLSSISNTTMNSGKNSKFEHYTMLYDDDEYVDDDIDSDDIVIRQPTTSKYSMDSVDKNVFVPQWSTNGSIMNSQKGTDEEYSSEDNDDSDSDDDDDDEFDFNIQPNTNEFDTTSITNNLSQVTTTKHNQMGSFPSLCDPLHDRSPLVGLREAEEKCGVYILRHDDDDEYDDDDNNITTNNNNNNSNYTKSMSDSETEEDTSSSSSSSSESFLLSTSFHNNNDIDDTDDTKRRTIRFSDEIAGQSLTTIHLVPWSEHDDMNWIPRPVRCRIEL